MIKLVIDGTPVEAAERTTVLKAAAQAGIAIPHFCYHPAFVPEGSCRLCLIEIEGSPKLELGCSTVVREGMKVTTQSAAVRAARRSVLEFLLAEHPLDCPICDKAGECKLQDYYQEVGLTESVFREFKEKREKRLRIGDTLLLDRERCIQCTRCVRFLAEITKTHELGVFERGVHCEIGIYDGTPVRNNYSGNLVDLCPVGAITDTEFRFKTRPWFLQKGESICPHCSRGCNIYVDYHPGFPRVPGSAKVYRIRPRVNDSVNGHFICDYGRTRFLDVQRDNRSEKVLWNKGGQPAELSWDKALILISEKIKNLIEKKTTDRIGLILTSGLTNEELFLVREIFLRDLSAGILGFCDPAPGEEDGILLRSDRSPNRKGAVELGFDPSPVSLQALAGRWDILFMFGPHLGEMFEIQALRAALDRIGTKILVTSHLDGLASMADFIWPAATTAEKAGSFTNADGRVQTFQAVARPCGEVRSELRMLLDLAAAVRLREPFYARLADADAVRGTMLKEIPFFGERP